MDDWVPEALGRLDLDSLVGLGEAQARARVEAAGGRMRAVRPGWALGLPYSPGLVTVMTDDDDRVRSVLGLQGGVAEDHVPAALAMLQLDSLVGVSVAEARARVEGAGGELHVSTSWNAPFDVRPWRISVQLDGGHVVNVLGRG